MNFLMRIKKDLSRKNIRKKTKPVKKFHFLYGVLIDYKKDLGYNIISEIIRRFIWSYL